MNPALCCCEYKSDSGELNHLLACLCNCQSVDETFDSILCCRGVPKGSCGRIQATLADRIRIPYCDGRGARRINSAIVFYGLIFISPLLILLSWSQGPFAIAISVFVILPVFLKLSSEICFIYFLSSIFWLLLLMQFVILADLTITFGEHFIFMCGVIITCACGQYVRTQSILPINSFQDCKKNIWHSSWLSCSIQSEYYYSVFLFCVAISSGYFADLAMTNVCSFWIPFETTQDFLLLPYDCSLAFTETWSSLKMSGGLYGLSMACTAMVSLVLQASKSLQTYNRRNLVRFNF